MWKPGEAVRSPAPAPAPVPVSSAASAADAPAARDVARSADRHAAVCIGKSVLIKGELSASEDLTIEGQVDGKIELRQNVLTIGPNGKITAEVFAKAVVVQGEVHGNVTATERVDIRDAGSVDGDVSAPRVAIADGAHFRGSIDMQRGAGVAGGPVAVAKPGVPVAKSDAPVAKSEAPGGGALIAAVGPAATR